MSTFSSYFSFLISSGAIENIEPRIVFRVLLSAWTAKPKSASLILGPRSGSRDSTRMLSSLMSLWIYPFLCMVLRARSSCLAIKANPSSVYPPDLRLCYLTVPKAQNSKMMYRYVLLFKILSNLTIFGWSCCSRISTSYYCKFFTVFVRFFSLAYEIFLTQTRIPVFIC